MHLLATPFTFLEIAVFILALIVLIITVRFFMASQRRLENLLPDSKQKRKRSLGIDRDGFIVPTGKENSRSSMRSYEDAEHTKDEIKELRNMLQLQQLELSRAVRQMENMHVQKESSYHTPYEDDDDEEYREEKFNPKHSDPHEWDPLESTCRHASLSIL